MTPLQYAPGTKYQYANAGINTAGRLIEVLSGMSYEQFLQTRLFDPLGHEGYDVLADQSADYADWQNPISPMRTKPIWKKQRLRQLQYPLNDKTSRYPMPAGGLFSTAADLARFLPHDFEQRRELDGRRYVSEASVQEMTRKQTGNLPGWLRIGMGNGRGLVRTRRRVLHQHDH